MQDLRRQEVLVRFHAGGDDAQQEVIRTAHGVTFEHFGPVLDEAVELPHGVGVVVVQRHQGVRQNRQADRRSVQKCRVARDKAFLFQPSQPPPTGRRREPDAFSELLIGDPCIGLQGIENAPIDAIQRLSHAGPPIVAIILPRGA